MQQIVLQLRLSTTGLQGAAWGSTIGIIALGAWTSLDMEGLRAGPRSLDVISFLSSGVSLVQISLLVVHQLRTAIYMVLCILPMGLVLMGPDCSSWTLISRGTSWRAPHNPWGNLTLQWIQGANLMISRYLISIYVPRRVYIATSTCLPTLLSDSGASLRLTLIMQLTIALGCKFLCEQPSGSEHVFARHHRFEEFCNSCCFVA